MKVLSTSIALLSYVSMALAVKQFKFCREFTSQPADAQEQQGVNITLLQDSTVLLFGLKDLPDTNIPLLYDEKYNLKENRDGFVLCTEELVASGECSKIGEFRIKKTADLQQPLLNMFAKKGDQFFYPINNSGVYCLYGYHSSEEPGVEYRFYKPYGSLTSSDAKKWKFVTFVAIPLAIILLLGFGAKFLFTKRKGDKTSLVFGSVDAACSLMSIMLFNYYMLLTTKLNVFDVEGYSPLQGEFFFGLLSNRVLFEYSSSIMHLLVYSFLLAFSKGGNGTVYDQSVKPTRAYGYVCLAILFASVWVQTGLYGIYERFDLLMNLINNFGYYVIWGFIFQYSKITISEITNESTKRKFIRSRRLTIFTPVFLSLISGFSMIALSFNASQNFVQEHPEIDPVKDMDKVFIHTMENSNSRSIILAVLENLPSLSFFIIILGYSAIWQTTKSGEKLASKDNNMSDPDTENLLVDFKEKV